MSRNEEVMIYDKNYGQRRATAWRRLPDVPDWRVYVQYGDSGYECDPGTYGESIETAVSDVTKAVAELTELLAALKKFQSEGK